MPRPVEEHKNLPPIRIGGEDSSMPEKVPLEIGLIFTGRPIPYSSTKGLVQGLVQYYAKISSIDGRGNPIDAQVYVHNTNLFMPEGLEKPRGSGIPLYHRLLVIRQPLTRSPGRSPYESVPLRAITSGETDRYSLSIKQNPLQRSNTLALIQAILNNEREINAYNPIVSEDITQLRELARNSRGLLSKLHEFLISGKGFEGLPLRKAFPENKT